MDPMMDRYSIDDIRCARGQRVLAPVLAMLGALVYPGARAGRDTSPRGTSVPVRPAAAHRAARNERCPCGSGRKFKRCCRGV